jgi:Rod binding domain-containing protein
MDMIKQDTSITLLQAAQSEAKRVAGNLKNSAANNKQIEEAAKEFEAVFLSAMLKPMFEQIEIDSNFGGGKGEEVFRGIMVQEYGKMISETQTIGLAEHVKAELLRIQEEANNV